MFYSSICTYDDTPLSDYNIYLVSQSNDILNTYGVNYSKEEEGEITLTFCYSDEYNNPLTWTNDALMFVHGLFIKDEFKPFISEDNLDIMYLMKGISIEKRLDSSLQGLIDVTFELYSSNGYIKQDTVVANNASFKIYNPSNLNKTYKPVISLKNINSNVVTISNLTTNKDSLTINTNGISEVIIDNEIGTITDSEGNVIISKSNRKWIELANGNNNLSVSGDCRVTFECLYPVMI